MNPFAWTEHLEKALHLHRFLCEDAIEFQRAFDCYRDTIAEIEAGMPGYGSVEIPVMKVRDTGKVLYVKLREDDTSTVNFNLVTP